MDISHLWNETFVQQRSDATTRIPNGKGGFTDNFQTINSEVPGRINVAASADVLVGQQEKAKVDHVIYTDPGSDVRVNDRFLFGSRTFRVTVPNLTPSIAVYQKVGLEELQGA